MSLKQQALSGIKWTSISSFIIAIIQLLQLSILARYLTPSDFGLMALVTVIIGFSSLFMDMGISASIIHRQNIKHTELSSLYWVNVTSGVFLFLIVYSLAPMFADFYATNELTPIIQLLACSFVISGIGNQYAILQQKALRFDIIAKINTLSTFISLIISTTLAINGFGIYSLVYASLTSTLTSTTIYILTGRKTHKPSMYFKYKEIKPMLSFGMFQMGERGINYFNSQFDTILIGKLLGVEVLGIYTVAKNLAVRPAEIINPIITKVTFPVMAKVQNDLPQLKNIYLKTIGYLSSINFPIYLLIVLLAEPIILTLFGGQWNDSIIILQILSLYGAIRSTGNPVGSLQLARGRADLGFYWNLGLFFIIPLIIYIGSFWGLNGVAFSFLAAMLFLFAPAWYFLVKPLCGAGFKEYSWTVVRPLSIASVAATLAYTASTLLNIEDMIINSVIISTIMGGITLGLNVLFNPNLIALLHDLLRKNKK